MINYIPRLDYDFTEFDATSTNASDTLTSVSDTSAIVIGRTIKGPGIPFNTKVVAKTSTTIQMDKNATSTGVLESFVQCQVFEFEYPPRDDSEWDAKGIGTQAKSLSGLTNTVTNYIEETRKMTFSHVSKTLADSLRNIFITYGIQGHRIDFYEHKSEDVYETCELGVLNFQRDRMAKKHPYFLYRLDITLRKVV